MVEDVYFINFIAKDGETVTVHNTSPAPDWFRFVGGFELPTEIRLAWTVSNGIAVASSAIYYVRSDLGAVVGSRVIADFSVQNARGSIGQDFIQGNELGNILYGDADSTGAGDNDTLWGFDGNDTTYGGAFNDNITGDGGNDRLYGDAGADTLTGGAGRDTLEGGKGGDSLSGGADLLDLLAYSHSSKGVTIRVTFGTATTGIGGDAAGDTITGFNNVAGSDFDDKIIDTVAGAVAFSGNANKFDGAAGADLLDLGGGNDTGLGGDGNDIVRGGAGRDLVSGEDGDDRVSGGDGDDTVTGGTGVDSLTGDAGRDILAGGAGSDLLSGGTGGDSLTGGADADTFLFATVADSRAADRDTITDLTTGEDKIDLSHIDANPRTAAMDKLVFVADLSFSGTPGEVRLEVQAGGTLVLVNLDTDLRPEMAIFLEHVSTLGSGDFLLG